MIQTVNHALFTECSPQWSWKVDSLPDYDLWYVSSGSGLLKVDGKNLSVRKGCVVLLRPGSRIRGYQNPDNRLKVFAVHFQGTIPADIPGNEVVHLYQAELIKELFLRLVHGQEQSAGSAIIWLEALMLELQEQIERGKRFSGAESSPRSHLYHLSRKILSSPGNMWTLGDMAKEVGVCPDHLIRLFREAFSTTPGQYLLDARINKARDLLLESDDTVSHIAELCGFRSSPWFCRYFKARTGLTPGQFRNSPGCSQR